jgi:hypothetical protein
MELIHNELQAFARELELRATKSKGSA